MNYSKVTYLLRSENYCNGNDTGQCRITNYTAIHMLTGDVGIGYVIFYRITKHQLMSFKALLITESEDGKFNRHIVRREISDLPVGDLLIRVHYSALNFKDGLSATGHKGITRMFPHTPGIEAAGVVEESTNPKYPPGCEVFVTGYDL